MDDNIRHYICYWFRINNNVRPTPMGNNGGCMMLRLLMVLLGFIAAMLGVILAIHTQHDILGLLMVFGGMASVTEGLL
jgi:hypothetical protein